MLKRSKGNTWERCSAHEVRMALSDPGPRVSAPGRRASIPAPHFVIMAASEPSNSVICCWLWLSR